MFCNQCGNQIPDDAMFCPGCGAKKEIMEASVAQPVASVMEQPVQQPVMGAVPPVMPQKKSGKPAIPFKMLIPVAGAVVLLVIVLAVVFSGGGGSENDIRSKEELGYISDIHAFNVFPNTDDLYECEEEYVEGVQFSATYDSAIFMAFDDYAEKMLYYIDNKLEATLVAEDVNCAYISYTGEYIAYFQDVEDNSGDLYLYCVKNGKATQIDSNVYIYEVCMSPSGEAIGYIKDYESSTENELWVAGVSKEGVEIDKDGCRPIAVTDNGKYVYYLDEDNKLFLFDGKESEKISSETGGNYWVNNDATEIIYTRSDKTYYHTVKMDEAVKIAGDYLYGFVFPSDVVSFYNNAEIMGLETFKGAVLYCRDDILWLNKKGDETVEICNSGNLCQLSADGKSIIYVEGGDLFKIKKLSEDMEVTVLCDDMWVEDFAASEDLSRIYVASDSELYYVKGENKFVEISDDVEESYSGYYIAYNEEMGKIFFIEDDTLYYAGTKEKSAEEVEEEVSEVFESRDGIMFIIEDEDDYSYLYYYMESKEVIDLQVD